AADLAPNTVYYVTIGSGVILDQFNDPFAGLTSQTALNFVTSNGAGSGLVFNVSYDQSSGLPAELPAAMQAATKFFTDRFTDAITINLHVGWGEVHSHPINGALASSFVDAQSYSYDQIVKAIAGDVTSAEDYSASQNIPASDPTNGGTWVVGN